MNGFVPDDPAYFSAMFTRSRVNALLHLDKQGIIIAVNPAFTTFFGYENRDIAGKHFSLLFTQEDRLDRKPWREVENVIKFGQADDKNFMVHKNHQVSWVSGESILIEHAGGNQSILKMIQDIHQQKDAEISLNRANDFNESMLQVIDDFVVLLDSNLHVIKYNPSFPRVFFQDQSISFTDFSEFMLPYDRKGNLAQKIREVAETGIPFSKYVHEFITPAGERVFELSCQPIYTKEAASAIVLVGHDITVHQRAETEREDLMGFVVHELRNPLTAIRMSNDIMTVMLDNDTSDLAALLQKNKNNIERLTMMIAELYDAAKVGGAQFQLSMQSFDFDEMIQEAVESFRVLHPKAVIAVAGRADRPVTADRYRIMQVITNYLANAVKYSRDQQTIKVIVSVAAAGLQVAVEDNGVGISAGQMPFLFNRFFRAEKTRSLEGIGLGLYLCRRIIHAHGGEVWASSEDGRGSKFYFSLPLAQQ